MMRSFHVRKIAIPIGISTLLLLLAAVLVFQMPGSARAHTAGRIRFVGHAQGSNANCASPGYTSIQSAVDAAHAGDTVYLCASFAEQVIISKQLTLTGDRGAAINAPKSFPASSLALLPPQFAHDKLFVPDALVFVWGTHANVTITNLTIAGMMPGNNSCANDEYGVLVLAGAAVTLNNDHVNAIHDSNSSLYGCQFGSAIQIGRRSWPTADFAGSVVENFAGHATITNTTVVGYQKDGIVIDGPGSTANINWNHVNGSNRDTQFSPTIGQNGIEILRGAWASVSHNTILGNTYTGPAYASASGILVFGGCGDPLVKNMEIADNTLINNDVGIYLNDYSSAPDCSAPATTRTNNVAANNIIRNNAVTNVGYGGQSFPYKGYQTAIDDVGNYDVIINNTISGAGYVPGRAVVNGPFVLPIDTVSLQTLHPIVHGNHIR